MIVCKMFDCTLQFACSLKFPILIHFTVGSSEVFFSEVVATYLDPSNGWCSGKSPVDRSTPTPIGAKTLDSECMSNARMNCVI